MALPDEQVWSMMSWVQSSMGFLAIYGIHVQIDEHKCELTNNAAAVFFSNYYHINIWNYSCQSLNILEILSWKYYFKTSANPSCQSI